MAADSFEQAAAARTVERFLGDLCTWVIQPDPGGLPEGWAVACRDRLNELTQLIGNRFTREQAGDSEFRAAAAAARELIGILHSNPRVAAAPVSEWTSAAFVEVFERVAKHRRTFADLAVWRAAKAAGGRNPWRQAVAVLRSFAWVEGTPEPFPLGSAFDPQAAESWGQCVDAVAALPDEGGPLGIASRLKTRFSGTHSAAAGEVNGRVIWRWEGCPREPWVTSAEIAALQQAAANWDFLNSRESSGDDSREAVRVRRLAEWLQAIAAIDPLRLESLQLLQRAAAVVWGFERRADDELSTGEINAAAELSRALRPKIHQAAAALGFTAGDQADLFAADYSRRSNAWGALQAAAANRAAAALEPAVAALASGSPEPAAAAALSADHSPVNAKQLAAHAGCTDRVIRRYLADCPAETDRSGAKIWRYGAVLAKLRQWCEDNHQERLQAVVWPDRATNLKNKAAGTKKK